MIPRTYPKFRFAQRFWYMSWDDDDEMARER